MNLAIDTRVSMNHGGSIPVLGLGTWNLSPREARKAVPHALRSGYRLIDTAKLYGNEREVGEAVRESGVSREEVFVTTKLWNDDHGYKPTLRAFEASMDRLGLEYLDLYLVHWPEGLRAETWDAMEEILRGGRCRAIGVSNYTVRHLKEMLAAGGTVPAVNQVEFHPFLYQKELLAFCAANRIVVEAYSPLARGTKMKNPTLVAIAGEHGMTPAQVMLRWALQRGLVAIPKSAQLERIEENATVFDFALAEKEMTAIDALNEDYRVCWDPNRIP